MSGHAARKVCLLGAGGCAMSVYQMIVSMGRGEDIEAFLETEEYWQPRSLYGLPVWPISRFDPEHFRMLIALGSSESRSRVAQRMPQSTEYASYVHPQVMRLAPDELEFGDGSTVMPEGYFSRNVRIGRHAHIMPGVIIGHDVRIGDFFTCGARFTLGGECTIGDRVQCGMSVSIRDKTSICDDVVIGMGAVVTKSLTEPGVYYGNPARRVEGRQVQHGRIHHGHGTVKK